MNICVSVLIVPIIVALLTSCTTHNRISDIKPLVSFEDKNFKFNIKSVDSKSTKKVPGTLYLTKLNGYINDVVFSSDGLGVAVGDGGGVYIKRNGQQWVRLENITNYNLHAVYISDENNIWLAGGDYYGVVLSSKDGGRSWEENIFKEIRPIHDLFLDKSNSRGWAITGTSDGLSEDGLSELYRVDENGKNLYKVDYLLQSNKNEITKAWFVKDENIKAFTDTYNEFISQGEAEKQYIKSVLTKYGTHSDAGVNEAVAYIVSQTHDFIKNKKYKESMLFSNYKILNLGQIDDIVLDRKNNVNVVLYKGNETNNIEYSDIGIKNISFHFLKNKLDGWLCVNNSLFHTKDGGGTWDRVRSNRKLYCSDIYLIDDKKSGWVVEGNGNISMTRDGGHSWNDAFISYNGKGIKFRKLVFRRYGSKTNIGLVDRRGGVLLGEVNHSDGVLNIESYLLQGRYIDIDEINVSNKSEVTVVDYSTDKSLNKNYFYPFQYVGDEFHENICGIYQYIDTSWLPSIGKDGEVDYNNYNEPVTIRYTTDEEYNAIEFTGYGKETWMVGDSGKVFHSKNSCDNITKITKPKIFIDEDEYLDVQFDASGKRGFIVGTGGVVIKTDDGGHSWSRSIVRGVQNIYDVHISNNGEVVWIAGDDFFIATSKDGGETWLVHDLKIPYDSIEEYAVFNKNAMEQYLVSIEDIEKKLSEEELGEVTNAYNKALKSFDKYVVKSSIPVFRKIFLSKDLTHGWVVGGRSVIYHTNDGGENWYLQTSIPTGHLRDIVFLDDNQTGFAIDRNVIYFTVDGGINWEHISRYANINESFVVLKKVDDRVYALTEKGGIYAANIKPSKYRHVNVILDEILTKGQKDPDQDNVCSRSIEEKIPKGILLKNNNVIVFSEDYLKQISERANEDMRRIFDDKINSNLIKNRNYKKADGHHVKNWNKIVQNVVCNGNFPPSYRKLYGNNELFFDYEELAHKEIPFLIYVKGNGEYELGLSTDTEVPKKNSEIIINALKGLLNEVRIFVYFYSYDSYIRRDLIKTNKNVYLIDSDRELSPSVDLRGNLYVNHTIFEKMDGAEREVVMLHEAAHLSVSTSIFLPALIYRNKNSFLLNNIIDIKINEHIELETDIDRFVLMQYQYDTKKRLKYRELINSNYGNDRSLNNLRIKAIDIVNDYIEQKLFTDVNSWSFLYDWFMHNLISIHPNPESLFDSKFEFNTKFTNILSQIENSDYDVFYSRCLGYIDGYISNEKEGEVKCDEMYLDSRVSFSEFRKYINILLNYRFRLSETKNPLFKNVSDSNESLSPEVMDLIQGIENQKLFITDPEDISTKDTMTYLFVTTENNNSKSMLKAFRNITDNYGDVHGGLIINIAEDPDRFDAVVIRMIDQCKLNISSNSNFIYFEDRIKNHCFEFKVDDMAELLSVITTIRVTLLKEKSRRCEPLKHKIRQAIRPWIAKVDLEDLEDSVTKFADYIVDMVCLMGESTN